MAIGNIGTRDKIIWTGYIALSYASSSQMKGEITIPVLETLSVSNTCIITTIEAKSGTPYLQTNSLAATFSSSNKLQIYAAGGGYVSGHMLGVFVTIVKR